MRSPATSKHATLGLLRPNVACLDRSEEHTSELQSRSDLVCRLLLEKKKKKKQCVSLQQMLKSGEKIYCVSHIVRYVCISHVTRRQHVHVQCRAQRAYG